MACNLKPRTREENLMGVIAGNPNANPGVTPKTRTEAFLADIAENGGGGGGGGLPEVTSENNGDVLAVVDGEWAKAPAPSSLPPYTSADKGKVLTVEEDEEHPEQLVIYQGGGTLVDAEFTLTGAEAALNALPVNDPITVSVTANDVTTVCDTVKTSDNELLLTDLGPNSAIYKNGDVYTFWSQDLADGSSVTVEIYKVSPRYAPVWQTAGGYIAPAMSTTFASAITTGISAVIADIIQNSKTNLVHKRISLSSYADIESDYEILNGCATKYKDGVNVIIPLTSTQYSTVVNGGIDDGFSIQFIVPLYGADIPGVGQKHFYLAITSSGTVTEIFVHVAAQIMEELS